MIFTKENVSPYNNTCFKGEKLRLYQSDDVIIYGQAYQTCAWHVLNTDMLFNFNSDTERLAIYLGSDCRTRYLCFGEAIERSECWAESFIPLLRILIEYKLL